MQDTLEPRPTPLQQGFLMTALRRGDFVCFKMSIPCTVNRNESNLAEMIKAAVGEQKVFVLKSNPIRLSGLPVCVILAKEI